MKRLKGFRLKKFPLCGGEIKVSDICQYSRVHKITKSGRISKRYEIVDAGSMEVSLAGCHCGVNWNITDFEIDEEGYFIDYKHN